MIATLWLAPGALLRNDYQVPDPPPPSFMMMVVPPPDRMMLMGEAVPTHIDLHEAEFRLREYSRSGEVAHYELRTTPPAGFRWVAANGKLWTEHIKR